MKSADIKALFDRMERAMARRPAFARGSGQALIRLGTGFACDVEHADGTLLVDQPAAEGGEGAGPPPEELMRASLGASLAMGYRLWGARLGVAIEGVDVEVTCDHDARGRLGLSNDVAVGWERVRFHVTITSAEPEEDVRRVVATADRLSPMLANLAATVERTHHLRIARPDTRFPTRHETDAGERSVPSQVTPLGSYRNPKTRKRP
jgi:uncharacterized OsmC-like protein